MKFILLLLCFNFMLFAIDNSVLVYLDSTSNSGLFNLNNIKLHFNNKGNLGSIREYTFGESGGYFNNKMFLYSGGFFISGKKADTLFASGSFASSQIKDYVPGNLSSDVTARDIYTVTNNDADFSEAWLNWKNAVKHGAKFYDGNNDGIYDPIDLNSNNVWDSNEDKPFLIGDYTAWCVFNDSASISFQKKSAGIEVQQTIFGMKKNNYLDNYVFVNYKIVNKSNVKLDSIVFSPVADIDLGNANDDRMGSLKGYNSLFVYNKLSDNVFGDNVPVSFFSVILGPLSYIPGISFTDQNNNGYYDDGIDLPITNGYELNADFSIKEIKGAINLNNNSNNFYFSSDPERGDPYNAIHVRNYGLGLNRSGGLNDVCNFKYGEVVSGDCSVMNPLFYFSGNPFANSGWLTKTQTDYRVMNNSGLFSLQPNESKEILTAYHIGSGSNTAEGYSNGVKELDSLLEGLGIVRYIPTSVDDKLSAGINNYQLLNCYPNPFNPATNIEFIVPENGVYKVRVVDVLGREVSTLLNKELNAGSYKVTFDASSLSSGIYFYQLQGEKINLTKKMVLTK